MGAEEDIQRWLDERLDIGEEGWARGDDGELIWVRIEPDGSYTRRTPPPLNPPEPGKPLFGPENGT